MKCLKHLNAKSGRIHNFKGLLNSSLPPSLDLKAKTWCQHSESLYQSSALRLYDSESASKINTARWSSLQDKLR